MNLEPLYLHNPSSVATQIMPFLSSSTLFTKLFGNSESEVNSILNCALAQSDNARKDVVRIACFDI
jgi:hypothetical protein